jgi:hypothetical protein
VLFPQPTVLGQILWEMGVLLINKDPWEEGGQQDLEAGKVEQ